METTLHQMDFSYNMRFHVFFNILCVKHIVMRLFKKEHHNIQQVLDFCRETKNTAALFPFLEHGANYASQISTPAVFIQISLSFMMKETVQ